jgi:putative salt-induced outer membrane protein YdiY
MALARICIIVIALAALGAPARAQDEPDHWEVGLELGFNAARGNTYLTLFSTTFEVKRLETDLFELAWNATALYGENADSVIARRYRTGLNFDYRPEAKVSPFIFLDAERDKFRKLDVRTNVGAGAKYVLWRSEQTTGSLSAAVLHDYENFTAPLPGEDASRSSARWSIRAKAQGELDNGLALVNTTFFKPVFEEIDDYNIDATTKASLRVSERVALSLSWMFRYDSTPPPDVRKDDQTVQVGISLAL